MEVKKKKYDIILQLALSIELLHMATLIHDDINDNSPYRRGIKTYQLKWGSLNAVLFGDFLFTKSISILANLDNLNVIKNLSKTVENICKGEILQNLSRNNLNLSIYEYLKIIYNKTALLFGEASRISLHFLDSNVNLIRSFYHFGINLGMAFQIFDDYLDFVGLDNDMGKPSLQDYSDGKFTLPILYFFKDKNILERENLKNQLDEYKIAKDYEKIKNLLMEKKCFEYTLNLANKYAKKAESSINGLEMENKELHKHLKAILNFILKRKF